VLHSWKGGDAWDGKKGGRKENGHVCVAQVTRAAVEELAREQGCYKAL